MHTTTSADGTTIAYDRHGQGPALVIIGAGPVDRSANSALAELLGAHFTVYNYDRRGRGDSGDTQPYSEQREFEDLRAVIDAAGGSAAVFGSSGGAVIALEAVARGLNITKLVVWEPPYILPGTRPPVPADYRQRLVALLAEGRRGDMVELFFVSAVELPGEFVAQLRQSPFWADMEKIAHALVYDATLIGDSSMPTDRLATVTVPTLVVDGGTIPWMSAAADALATVLPDARRRTLAGQPHNFDPATMAGLLAESSS
ncbi:alpha/beta fold hydrolase [Nonomuraea sp. NPDC050536]|uniref:alpha/beta fold hydrolase n=1 Tax=Nonomuraea sp. NPDC050536 TaxID=3364366 RepID=UPI0037CA2CEA